MMRPILKNEPKRGRNEGGDSYFVITGANIGYMPQVTPSKNLPMRRVSKLVICIKTVDIILTAPMK
jgi:hypothetical protein